MSRALACTQPGVSRPVVVTVTININLDRLFWLAFAALWLIWVVLARAGRWLNHLYEIGRAVVVVAWRRIRRVMNRVERRFSWYCEGLVYGPCLGVG